MEILNIKNLSFTYPNAEKNALDNINLSVYEGEFVVLFGASGSGKSTLLRLIKKELAPFGKKRGEIVFLGKNTDELSQKESAQNIGFVMQNPKNQLVTNKVCYELSFGLENLGVSRDKIRRITAETADFFGISALYNKETDNLSGGQTQLLNLASIISMQPRLLLLDEPLSQLDPISRRELISMLKRLNEELSITIIIAEHTLEELLPIADKAVFLDGGELKEAATPEEMCKIISGNRQYKNTVMALPCPVRLYNALSVGEKCPLTIKQARSFITDNYGTKIKSLDMCDEQKQDNKKRDKLISLNDVCFRYEKKTEDVLSGVSLNINRGEIISVLGANGSGKTTLLKIICNILKPYSGRVKTQKGVKSFLLPQNPADLFVKDSIREDLLTVLDGKSSEENEKRLCEISEKLRITKLLSKNPLDLSGGEQQRAALAKLLLLYADVLLLDEPTKGMDVYSKEELADELKRLCSNGTSIVLVTHDIEFASYVSTRCMLLFNGQTVAEDIPRSFFSSNTFYQTAAGKISKNIFENVVTLDDIVKLCKINGRKGAAKNEKNSPKD